MFKPNAQHHWEEGELAPMDMASKKRTRELNHVNVLFCRHEDMPTHGRSRLATVVYTTPVESSDTGPRG